MLWRSSRGRPRNAPAGFIHPCQPKVAKRPPSGPGWAHELKHDGYRLQIHVREGRVKLYTMNGADWSKRYPRIVESASTIKGAAVLDAEAVWLDSEGVPNFEAPCTAARTTRTLPRLPSICFHSMATICGSYRLANARRR